jgi:ubiquitin carboxyl-terminal hydrolase 8
MACQGLVNLGNTCFINSALQVLAHSIELNKFMDNKHHWKNKLNKNNKLESMLLLEWDFLRKQLVLEGQKVPIIPTKFISIFHKIAEKNEINNFIGFQQNDLSEFVVFLIDCFHKAQTREVNITIQANIVDEKDVIALKCYTRIKEMYEKDYSEIWSLFYGIHVSYLTNVETNKTISMVPEPFFTISLPIPHDNKCPTLIDCFNMYVDYEMLEEENMVYDETAGKKVKAKKRILFWSLPNILIIDIKRYNHMNISKKNQRLVDFPLANLDLSNYVIGYNKNSYIYDLYGVCNHSGSLEGGHYTSFVKIENGIWCHFNDSYVTEVKDLSHIITSKAYCFFYRKRVI